MGLHDFERVQSLKVEEGVAIHHVDLADLVLDLLWKEEIVQHRFCLLQEDLSKGVRPELRHGVPVIDEVEEHEHVAGSLYLVKIGQQVRVAAVCRNLPEPLFARNQDAVDVLVIQLVDHLHEEVDLHF